MLQLLSCAIIVGCFCQAGSSNVAIGGTASQSSSFSNSQLPASNGIDGDFNTYFTTATEINPWWRVDLQTEFLVTSVVIHNRLDCCAHEAKNIKLTIGTSLDAMAEAGYTVGVDSSGVHAFSVCPPVSGRYVQLQLTGGIGDLHLREVQVFEEDNNIAVGKSASMITNLDNTKYLAPTGVDGYLGGAHIYSLTCFHTGSINEPWWRVDLGQSYNIVYVTVFNRMDCCSDRARQIQLAMGNSLTTLVQQGYLAGQFKRRHTFLLNPAVNARYVQLKLLNITEYFHLCEVKVIAQ